MEEHGGWVHDRHALPVCMRRSADGEVGFLGPRVHFTKITFNTAITTLTNAWSTTLRVLRRLVFCRCSEEQRTLHCIFISPSNPTSQTLRQGFNVPSSASHLSPLKDTKEQRPPHLARPTRPLPKLKKTNKGSVNRSSHPPNKPLVHPSPHAPRHEPPVRKKHSTVFDSDACISRPWYVAWRPGRRVSRLRKFNYRAQRIFLLTAVKKRAGLAFRSTRACGPC